VFDIGKGLLLKLFPSLGPKGVISTQISIYKKLKKKYPTTPEDDILNTLIISRIKSPLSPSNSQEESLYYKNILEDSNKKLEDVIWAIVDYEYIISRFGNYQNLKDFLLRKMAKYNYSPEHIQEYIEDEKNEWLHYIRKKIKDLN
jgi:hypothetical protein